MILYQVTYSRIDWDLYFCGYASYYYKENQLFTTREKAQAFVDRELSEYVPTWHKYETVKKSGEGKITEVCAD